MSVDKEKKPLYKKIWFWLLIVFVFLIFIMFLGMSSSDSEEKNAENLEQNNSIVENSDNDVKVPLEYENALKKAKLYVKEMSMSKLAVYKQLISEAEGFPEEAAKYAIDNLDFNWNEVALQKAKLYVKDMAMSKSAVYKQLISEAEGFTEAEAKYAVDNLE